MRIVFSKVFGDSQGPYIREKLKSGFRRHVELGAELDDDYLDKQVANAIDHQVGTEVPIAHPDAFYEITSEQEAEIEARKRCALAGLLREAPLLEDETVQEDFFAFLKEPFDDLQANTVVLRRTTNMAQLFYLFDDVQVIDGDLVFIEPVTVPHTTVFVARRALLGSLDVKSIAKDLGSGLVSGIAGKIGALIFEAIFPPGVPDYFDEVYKEIRNIVNEEITSATIDNVNGRINGVVAWLKNTYKPRKEADVSREELLTMVGRQVELLYTEAVYTLMEKRYAKPGLPVFMVAAGVHLGLMQEQALVDPRQSDPRKSSFATSVKLNAQTYHDHLVATFDAIISEREKAVQIMYDPLVFQDPGSPYISTKDRYRWYDSVTKKSGNLHEQYVDKDKKNHSGREEAEADRQNYLPGVIGQLTRDLGTPKDTANQWLKLTTSPIPLR